MKSKITLKLTIMMFVFGAILIIAQSINLRKNSIDTGINKAKAIAEVVKAGLTSHMINGNMDKREIYLKSISQTEYIDNIWVSRSENVTSEYPNSLNLSKPQDAIDLEVLKTGKMNYMLEDHLITSKLRVTIPYNAEINEQINCMSCHNVSNGDTLGAVTIVMDITDIKEIGISNTLITALLLFITTIVAVLMMRNFLKPYFSILETLSLKIDYASNGVFKTIKNTNKYPNEIKDIAEKYNTLTNSLLDTFLKIDRKLKTFVGGAYNNDENSFANPLEEASQIITNLSHIYKFKNEIQLDTTKHEIYDRLGQVLINKFKITNLNVVEVREHYASEVVYQIGDLDFCTASIIENSDNCRVLKDSNDVCSVEYHKACPHFSSDKYLHHCLDIEIEKSSKIIFNFIFQNSSEVEYFSERLPFIKSFIKEVAPEVKSRILREVLEESALKDSLTGLYNRRFLDLQIKKLVPQAIREKFNIGMLMLDMDHFKAVNDEYGHDIGDLVLKEFARVVNESIRDSDIAVRFGGEEFVILLVGVKNEEDALIVANKIRVKIAENKINVYAGSTLSKTVSVGLSMFPQDSEVFDNIIKYSDTALYEAKNTGRNQVVRYAENPSDELELF